MKSLLARTSLVLFSVLPLESGTQPAQQAAPSIGSLLRVVPADASMVIHGHGLERLASLGDHNAWLQLAREPEFERFFEWLGDALESGGRPEGVPSGLFDLLGNIRGGFVAYSLGSITDPQGFGSIIDPGSGRAEFEPLLAELLEITTQAAAFVHDEVEVALSEQEHSTKLYFELDGLHVMADGPDREQAAQMARDLIQRLRASEVSGGIDQTPLWLAAQAGAQDAPLEVFVNTERMYGGMLSLMNGLEAPSADELEEGFSPARLFHLMGFEGITWFHQTLDLGQGERLATNLRMAAPDDHLASMLKAFGPAPVDLARFAPANSNRIALIHFDLLTVVESWWDLIADLDPEIYEQARNGYEEALQGLGGIDLEGDLLMRMTGDFASISVPVPAAEYAAAGDPALQGLPEEYLFGEAYVIGLEEAEDVELFIEELIGMVGMFAGFGVGDIETESMGPYTINALERDAFGVWWCFTDEHALVSIYPTALRSVLTQCTESAGPSLVDDERYAAMFERYGHVSGLAITSSRFMVEFGLNAFDSAQAQMAEGSGPWSNVEAEDDVNWAAIPVPNPEVVARHLKGLAAATFEPAEGELRVSLFTE